jgi:hypothetical protein
MLDNRMEVPIIRVAALLRRWDRETNGKHRSQEWGGKKYDYQHQFEEPTAATH